MSAKARKLSEAARISRRSILLVETNAAVLILVKAVLEGKGHRVFVASCADTAMRLVARPQLRIDHLMTNLADSQSPELAARILNIRPQIEMLFLATIKDRDALRLKLIDETTQSSAAGGTRKVLSNAQASNRARNCQSRMQQPKVADR